MTNPIPDEAVEAAARALWQWYWPDTPFEDGYEDDQHTYREDASRALTAAAPLILAARDEQLRGLVDEFRSNIDWSDGRSGYSDNLAWESAADILAALLDGGSYE